MSVFDVTVRNDATDGISIMKGKKPRDRKEDIADRAASKSIKEGKTVEIQAFDGRKC